MENDIVASQQRPNVFQRAATNCSPLCLPTIALNDISTAKKKPHQTKNQKTQQATTYATHINVTRFSVVTHVRNVYGTDQGILFAFYYLTFLFFDITDFCGFY